jgi:transcriptional regulator with XRE-family HTH domain
MSLRIARKIAGLSQMELAKKAGVDNSKISQLESGTSDLRTAQYHTVVAIARALGLEPEELFAIAAVIEPKPRVTTADDPKPRTGTR